MKTSTRQEKIISLIDQHSFLSVSELSRLCNVSEMTIRRDLEQLHTQKRIQRTYGGAVSIHNGIADSDESSETNGTVQNPRVDMLLVDQVDVLIATSVNPYLDKLLIDRAIKKNIPIIAESIEMPNELTLVAVDNYQAGFDLGHWTGKYLQKKKVKNARLLDLSFHQVNTQNRSRGFGDGLKKAGLQHETVLSINSQSRYSTSYQLTRDALTVYPDINLIFAINDITAWGAINACRDLNIDPSNMMVVTFGLEGDTLKNEMMQPDSYCKAGLAMFPEIVSLTCIEAAIAAFNHKPLPENYITPHVVLTAATLSEYYKNDETGWQLDWEMARNKLKIPIQIEREIHAFSANLPHRIGLIVPFVEHEWYKNLTILLKDYAGKYGISLQVIDAEQNVREEIEMRRQQIAAKAAALIKPGDVVLVDGGPMAVYLAEELKQKKDVTVITNSVKVFDTLNHTPGIVLISTGGTVRYNTQMLVGPTTEGALRELRADTLFLMASGITLDFGLSHNTISEVTVKQAMIRSAREVVLLADHTAFGAEVGIQVAPLKAVHNLITDDALPASMRLDISKAGILITVA